MVLLGDDKKRLAELREIIREWLTAERLRVHPNKAHITRVHDGLNLLGYFVYRKQRLLRNDNGHRFARRLRAMANGYAAGYVQWSEITPWIQSWIGQRSMPTPTDFVKRYSPRLFSRGERASDGQRVMRGGSWNNKPENLRASNRNRNNADNRNNNVGFRLAPSARTAILPVQSRSVYGQVGRGSGHP